MRPHRYILLITAPILGTSILLVMAGGTAAWYVHRLNHGVSDLLTLQFQCTDAAEDLVSGISNAHADMNEFLETQDIEALRRAMMTEEATSKSLADAEEAATTEDLRQLIARIGDKHDKFYTRFRDVMKDMPPEERKEAVRELTEDLTANVLQSANQLLDRSQQYCREHADQNQKLADVMGQGLLVLGACGAVGGMMAGFGIAREIARRIELSERQAARSEQLVAVGQLAAGLAHELRNPLMAMRVLVEAGLEAAPGPDGRGLDRRDLQVLDEEITRLDRLVESFLDFARPARPKKTTLDARALVDQTLHLMAGAARQRGVAIRWQPPSEAVVIVADPAQMRQVLLNVLLNAMDAAQEGGTVTVETAWAHGPPVAAEDQISSAPRGRGCAVIQVSDSGAGVADDVKERIFDPFFSTKETGLGLGLAVSRRIVEAHGGSISAADNPMGGARFVICLPAAQRSASDNGSGPPPTTDERHAYTASR